MKTTVDLPADLVQRLKLRAVKEGRKLKELVADMLRAGLDAPATPVKRKPIVIVKDKRSGLPIIVGPKVTGSGKSMTPEEMAQVLINQEAEWTRDSGR